MNSTKYQTKNSFFHRLLIWSLIVVILPGLMLPGIASAAANPASSPYIIVFKNAEIGRAHV